MTLRVSGLASGIDVDSIVKEMMTAKRIPLDKLNQQKQTLQWQRDNYREMNSKLVDFRNNKLLKYNTSAQLNTQKAVVSGNTTALTAEATSTANGIPMTISVTQLAKPASHATKGMGMVDGSGNRLTSNSKLTELQALNGGTPTAGEYKLTLNGTEIKFSENISIAEVVSKINMTSAAKVTAKFDELTGKLTISSNIFSSGGTVTLGADNSLLTLFGSAGATDFTPYQSSEVYINGTAPANKLTFSSNNFSINGVQINLLSTTTAPVTPPALPDPSSGTPVTINTQSDPAKALETIKNFIQDYNDLLNTLNSKITEEKYRDFTPLTDEQKKEMKDNDIEQWEIKAKSGMLKNDEILKSTISSMRSIITNQLGDLSSIGITTGKYFENGKLYIDEVKLKAALQNNPQNVTTILQGSTSTDGVFDRLSDGINTALDKISTKAGTSKYSTDLNSTYKSESIIGKRLTDYNTRISVFQNRLNDMESNYYKQFTAMETAINKYNSQSSNLTSSLS
ncbi:flagellar filament capping protein FliD [Paenibacillus sp. BR2-3]|uniref:flagellar filament capping protein FliD n=1 Tax=Paenibacillus sp. BR2-3 TaxID=3048494 RepID=UPI0039774CE9